MKQSDNEHSARWASVVGDRVIPMPRRVVPVQLIREQAGIDPSLRLARDYQSPDDELLNEAGDVDLSKGNVFRVVSGCNVEGGGIIPKSPPKLAFVVDDRFEIFIKPEQTEASLRRQFDLHPRIQLLRDLEGPNDTPLEDSEIVKFEDGPVFMSCTEIEKHCECGEPPPRTKRYIIRVDKIRLVVDHPDPTGREILVLAGKNPEKTMLNQKIGKGFQPVGLGQKVDLTACGVERFTTLPNEQSEGSGVLVRDFALPEENEAMLDGSGLDWETVKDGNSKWLIIKGVGLPEKFLQRDTAMAIQIPSGYPAAALDMAYFNPGIQRSDGAVIPATESVIQLLGLPWQRWSRHYTSANPWKMGEYDVMTHYLLALSWMDREARRI